MCFFFFETLLFLYCASRVIHRIKRVERKIHNDVDERNTCGMTHREEEKKQISILPRSTDE